MTELALTSGAAIKRTAVAIAAGLAVLAGPVRASEAPSPPATDSAAPKYFGGLILTDQTGRRQRLYEDLMVGQVVVINSFYVNCRAGCPSAMAVVSRLQDRVGDGLNHGVRFISISIDPANDTPERLRDYAGRLGAKPGWYLLTGDRAAIDLALHRFGLAPLGGDLAGQSNFVLIGNVRTGLWKKAFGLGATEEIARVLDSVVADDPH